MAEPVDFFISRAGPDAAMGRQIGEWLEATPGRRVFIQDWDVEPGADFIVRIHDALAGGARVISLLSPAYFASPFCKMEWASALAADPTGTLVRLIPLRIANCMPPGLFASRNFIDLVGADAETARRSTLGAAGAALLGRERAGGSWPAAFDPVAIRNLEWFDRETFTGREDELRRLYEVLTGADRRAAVVTAVGLGGVGKSTLARAYADRHLTDHHVIWWVRSESPDTLTADLADLAVALDPAQREVADLGALAKDALRRADAWTGDKPCLLIFDNVPGPDAIRAWLPQQNARALITSRYMTWPGAQPPVEVESLGAEEAARLLLRASGRGDAAGAAALAETLGGLPLALVQAAAHLRENPLLSFAAYGERLDRYLARPAEGTGYPLTVAATFDAALDAVADKAPAARDILALAAFSAPDRLPVELIAASAKHAPDEARSRLADDAERADAFAALARYALIDIESDPLGPVFHVHRVVQAVVRTRLAAAGTDAVWAEAAIAGAAAAMPDPKDHKLWPLAARIAPHAAAMDAASPIAAVVGRARLLGEIGYYCWARADYTQGIELERRALALDEAAHGKDSSQVALRLNNLAQSLRSVGQLKEAELLMRRALQIDEAAGSDRLEVAARLGNLAELLQDTNRLEEAEPLMRQALAIAEAACGPDHPTVATALSNLAQLLQATNRLKEAESLMRRVLAIDEAAYEPDHPEVSIDLSNLAGLLYSTNRLIEAEPLMRRALALAEAAFGPDHPAVAIRLNNLAQLLCATNRFEEAEPLMRQALSIDEVACGPDHPTVATGLSNLAQLLQATNRLGRAEPLMRRALAIDEAAYGPDHPQVAIRLNNLAGLLHATNRLAGAEPLMRRALAIFRSSFGEDHPRFRTVEANLEVLLAEKDGGGDPPRTPPKRKGSWWPFGGKG